MPGEMGPEAWIKPEKRMNQRAQTEPEKQINRKTQANPEKQMNRKASTSPGRSFTAKYRTRLLRTEAKYYSWATAIHIPMTFPEYFTKWQRRADTRWTYMT